MPIQSLENSLKYALCLQMAMHDTQPWPAAWFLLKELSFGGNTFY